MRPQFKELFPLLRGAVVVFSSLWLTTSLSVQAQQHGHIYAGATNQNPGAPLWFQNGNVWDTNSYGGYTQAPACIYFQDNIPDQYPGLYQTATTFAALPATIFYGGPNANAAALGTYIEMKFVSLQGPAGGSLTVWNEVDDPANPAAVLTIVVGTTNGTNRLNLSQGDPGDPESDPYGHIHGRRFTLNRAGLYIAGLQLVDTAHNGPGNGPKHSPSAVTYFYLQAGLALSNFARSNNVTVARFGLPGSANYAFESSSVVPGSNWTAVANINGTTHSEVRWVRDTNATGTTRFYRLRKTN